MLWASSTLSDAPYLSYVETLVSESQSYTFDYAALSLSRRLHCMVNRLPIGHLPQPRCLASSLVALGQPDRAPRLE